MGHRRWVRWLVALLGIVPAWCQAIDIMPRIGIAEIYSSNVDLQPDGEEEDDWVTSLTPGVTVGLQGSGVRLDLDYTLEALFYLNDSDRNEVYNQLAATTLFDIIGENLQLWADGSIDQVNVSPSKPVTSTNINVTDNRADAIAWDAGPVWSQPVFADSLLEGQLLVGRVNYDTIEAGDETTVVTDVDIQDVDTLNGGVSLHSVLESAARLTYELAYEYERLDYEESGDATQQSTWLQLGYRIRPEFQVFVLGGLDSDFEEIDDSSLNQGRWEIGFNTASATNVFEAAVGHRYFGSTWRVNFLRERGNATYTLSYDETPTTTDLTDIREIPVYPPSPNPPPLPPDSDLGQPGSPDRYLLKRADAAARWELHRSALLIDVFWERQEDRIAIDPLLAQPEDAEDERSYGAGIDWAWFVGPKSEAGITLSWVNREYIDDDDPISSFTGEDDQSAITLRFDHELGPRTLLGFALGYDNREVSEGDENDYDEYWGRIGIVRMFGKQPSGINRRDPTFPRR